MFRILQQSPSSRSHHISFFVKLLFLFHPNRLVFFLFSALLESFSLGRYILRSGMHCFFHVSYVAYSSSCISSLSPSWICIYSWTPSRSSIVSPSCVIILPVIVLLFRCLDIFLSSGRRNKRLSSSKYESNPGHFIQHILLFCLPFGNPLSHIHREGKNGRNTVPPSQNNIQIL